MAPYSGISFLINPTPAKQSPHHDVLDVFTELVRVLVNPLGIFADFLRILVDAFGIFTHSLCVLIDVSGIPTNLFRALVNALGDFIDLLCVLVGVLLYRRLSKTSDSPRGSAGRTYLVICHSSVQISDETVQGLGMISILQELHDPMSFGKRFELRNYTIQLPEDSHCDLGMWWSLSKEVSQTFLERLSAPSLHCPGPLPGIQVTF